MGFFKAGTQYGDWKGTSAADGYQGSSGFDDYLENKGLLRNGESCVGISFGVGENTVGEKATVYGSAILVRGTSTKDINESMAATPDPIPVRRVQFEMTEMDFALVFKRFDIMLLLQGLDIEDREYQVVEDF